MELSNRVVFNVQMNDAIGRLIKNKFNSVISLELVKLVKILQETSKDVITVRDNLINTYGKIENNKVEFNSKEDELEFHNQMNDLLNQNFEINLKEKIVLPKNIDISGEDILILEDIIYIQ